MAITYRKDRECYVVKVTVDGKYIKRQAKTKEKALQMEKDLLERTLVADKDIYQACKQYLKEVSKTKSNGHSERLYLSRFIQYFDELNIKLVNQIKPRNTLGLQTWLLKKHNIKASTVNRYFSTYRHFLKWCHMHEYHHSIPTQSLKQLNIDPVEKRPMTEEEFLAILHQSYDWLKPPLLFMRMTGMRPSSFCRLCWKDVDFENMRVMYRSKKGNGSEKEKSFPITEKLKELLMTLRMNGPLKAPNSPVFTNRAGGVLKPGHFTKAASKARKRAGVETPVYRLRDAFVTDLIQSGVPSSRAINLTGHASERMLRSYVGDMPSEIMVKDLECLESMRSDYERVHLANGAEMAQKGGVRHL